MPLAETATPIRFVALGGVWLDTIQIGSEIVLKDAVGGSVTFATLGARMFEHMNPQQIKLVVITGHDFPATALTVLQNWEVDLITRRSQTQPSARGIVEYDRQTTNRLSYTRLTPPLLTRPSSLAPSDIQRTRAFHFFDTPDRVLVQVQEIRSAAPDARPLVIWEPQAKSCSPATFAQHTAAARSVSVFSPNHVELSALCTGATAAQSSGFEWDVVAAQASRFLTQTGISLAAVVVRCAEHGCYIATAANVPGTWLPAFYASESSCVVDPTGAGNAFLGGFAIGYLECGDPVVAAQYGTVAASFAVEQVGLPTHEGFQEEETWNDVKVRRRLTEYQSRLQRPTEQ